MSNFETLICEKNIEYNERWKPTFIEPFMGLVDQGILKDMPDEIKHNIAYSMQYLQFLELQIKELNMHSIIVKMVYKTYIITSVSIIEAIFIQIVKNAGLWKTTNWEKIKSLETKEYEVDNIKYMLENSIYKKLDESKEETMNFDCVLKKVKDKKLINVEQEKLYALNRFRQLRNKIHLQIHDAGKTNWHEFSKNEYITIKYLLYCILTDEKLENIANHTYLEFLKLSLEEEKTVAKLAKD